MSPELADTLVYKVDFNVFDDDGRLLKTSLYHGLTGRTPRLGERVILKDAEGNMCWGVFRHANGVMAFFELDDSTWISGDTNRTEFVGEYSVGASPPEPSYA